LATGYGLATASVVCHIQITPHSLLQNIMKYVNTLHSMMP